MPTGTNGRCRSVRSSDAMDRGALPSAHDAQPSSKAPPSRGRVEVGWFVGDPRQEGLQIRLLRESRSFRAHLGQVHVAEAGVDGAVADRVHRHRCAAAAALGRGMMPFHAATERPAAEPARVACQARRLRSRRCRTFLRFSPAPARGAPLPVAAVGHADGIAGVPWVGGCVRSCSGAIRCNFVAHCREET